MRLENPVSTNFLNVVLQHFFCHGEIGNNTVLQRPNDGNGFWIAANHPVGGLAYRNHFAAPGVAGNDGGLRQDDAAALYIDHNRAGSQIDPHA